MLDLSYENPDIILEDIFEILDECRKKITTYRNNNQIIIESKDVNDFVTNLDINIQKYIIQRLKKKYSSHSYISEEKELVYAEANSDYVWIIDPLDGTVNFINNIGFCAISICLVYKSKPLLSVVYDFNNNEIFDAISGRGARMNKKQITENTFPSNIVGLSTGFIKNSNKHTPDFIEYISNNYKIRILGSQSLHLCYVAANRLIGNINIECKIWDDIAGSLIVTECNKNYEALNEIDLTSTEERTSNLFSLSGTKKFCDTVRDSYNTLYMLMRK